MSSVPSIRLRPVNAAPERPDADHVLYWMTSARRLDHNFALQHAVDLARARDLPLIVLEALRAGYARASDRLHRFVLDGMAEHDRRLDGSKVRSARFRPVYKWFFWLFAIDCVILGYIGSRPAEPPYTYIGQWATLYYFAHFIILVPLIARFERPKPLPHSISEPVLKGGGGAAASAPAKPMEKA